MLVVLYLGQAFTERWIWARVLRFAALNDSYYFRAPFKAGNPLLGSLAGIGLDSALLLVNDKPYLY